MRRCRIEAAQATLLALISHSFLVSRLLWAERLARNAEPAESQVEGWVCLDQAGQTPPPSELMADDGQPMTPGALHAMLAAMGFRWQDGRDSDEQ